MNIRLLESEFDGCLWNEFLSRCPDSTVYHRWEWRRVFSGTYNFQLRYWAAFEGNDICAVFPAVVMRGLNLRKNWVSLPYVQSAGPLHSCQSLLIEFSEAVIASERANGFDTFQLRSSDNLSLSNFSQLNSYVTMKLDISSDLDSIWKHRLHTHRRNEVRKAIKNDISTLRATPELLNGFYDIWSKRINQLGTPVFPKQFFCEIISAFGRDAWIQGVEKNGSLVGAMLLLTHNDVVYDPWAATRPEYNRLGTNSLLYWSAIEEAKEGGCQSFDLGRSEREGGTFKFKSKWGAEPAALRYLYDPMLSNEVSAGQKYQLLIKLWQLQPNKLANTVGPYVTRFLTDL